MSGPANPEEARALCADLLTRLRALETAYPGENTIASMRKQLEYIEPFLAQPGGEMPRKDSLNFGFYAVRFVCDFDESVSGDGAELSQYVERTFSSPAAAPAPAPAPDFLNGVRLLKWHTGNGRSKRDARALILELPEWLHVVAEADIAAFAENQASLLRATIAWGQAFTVASPRFPACWRRRWLGILPYGNLRSGVYPHDGQTPWLKKTVIEPVAADTELEAMF